MHGRGTITLDDGSKVAGSFGDCSPFVPSPSPNSSWKCLIAHATGDTEKDDSGKADSRQLVLVEIAL
jgi:hypothetical protein